MSKKDEASGSTPPTATVATIDVFRTSRVEESIRDRTILMFVAVNDVVMLDTMQPSKTIKDLVKNDCVSSKVADIIDTLTTKEKDGKKEYVMLPEQLQSILDCPMITDDPELILDCTTAIKVAPRAAD